MSCMLHHAAVDPGSTPNVCTDLQGPASAAAAIFHRMLRGIVRAKLPCKKGAIGPMAPKSRV